MPIGRDHYFANTRLNHTFKASYKNNDENLFFKKIFSFFHNFRFSQINSAFTSIEFPIKQNIDYELNSIWGRILAFPSL